MPQVGLDQTVFTSSLVLLYLTDLDLSLKFLVLILSYPIVPFVLLAGGGFLISVSDHLRDCRAFGPGSHAKVERGCPLVVKIIHDQRLT